MRHNAKYSHYKAPSYSENGSSAFLQDVDQFTTSEMLLGLGLTSQYNIDTESKFITTLNVDYDVHDKQDTVSSSFQGASGVSFDTAGIDNGKTTYSLGLGYERSLTNDSTINFTYDYEAQGSKYSTNAVSMKYVLTF